MSTNQLSSEGAFDILELQNNWFRAYRADSKWLKQSYLDLEGYKKPRTRLSMNSAKIACAELANLLFSEPPQIEADKAILDILKANKFLKNSKNLSEYIAALGGGAYKLRSDGERIMIDYVKAYNIKPISNSNGEIEEADFLSERVIKNKTFTLVEKHRRLYKNIPLQNEDGTMLTVKGMPVLSDELSFEGYSITTEMYDAGRKVDLPPDINGYQEMRVKRPLFTYIKTSLANNFNPDSPIGISYYANALDTLQALDVAFDCLFSELELGQKRIIVPTSALRTVTDKTTGKQSRYFDPTDRVFVAFKADQDTGDLDIKDNSTELRTEEIKNAIQVLLDILCMQIGFSAGYMAFDSGGMKTATEVISNNSKTFKTKTAFENEMSEGMVDIMNSIREVLEIGGSTLSTDEYSVTFDDSVIEDRSSKMLYWADMVLNGFATKTMAIMKIYGISEEEAKKRVALIALEAPKPVGISF